MTITVFQSIGILFKSGPSHWGRYIFITIIILLYFYIITIKLNCSSSTSKPLFVYLFTYTYSVLTVVLCESHAGSVGYDFKSNGEIISFDVGVWVEIIFERDFDFGFDIIIGLILCGFYLITNKTETSYNCVRPLSERLNPHILKVILVTFVSKGVKLPPGVSQLLEYLGTKFQRLPPYLRGQTCQWCYQ